jgi:hypothetical protein
MRTEPLNDLCPYRGPMGRCFVVRCQNASWTVVPQGGIPVVDQ